MMDLFLEAVDVWLFRDGRPFDAGSDHRARSLFPPYPTVIQGALRSHHLVVQGVNLNDRQAVEAAVGTADDVRNLRLRGPFLARREGDRVARYLPQPADAVTVDRPQCTLRPASRPRAPDDGVLTGAPTPLLLGLDDEAGKGEEGLWLREADLHRYLQGETVAGAPAKALFQRESRFGIGLDRRRHTAAEGALYEAEFIRPCPGVGLLVEVEGYDGWPRSGVLRIGGEGRAAWFEQVAAPPWPAPPDPLPERFTLYFATPAYFTDGWRPRGGWGQFFLGHVELVAAAVGRYESVGGFDLAEGKHKPARRYVPAGSVYYFRATGEARLRPELVQGAVTEHGAALGFGQVLIGEW
jgi:CRISPR-associated protein Cmr3